MYVRVLRVRPHRLPKHRPSTCGECGLYGSRHGVLLTESSPHARHSLGERCESANPARTRVCGLMDLSYSESLLLCLWERCGGVGGYYHIVPSTVLPHCFGVRGGCVVYGECAQIHIDHLSYSGGVLGVLGMGCGVAGGMLRRRCEGPGGHSNTPYPGKYSAVRSSATS